MRSIDVLVVGAGMAGLTLANKVKKLGLSVLVVEKARGSGGRLSAKSIKSDTNEGHSESVSFDLGCTAIQAKSADFKSFLIEHGAQLWRKENGQSDLFVGVPRNSAITRALLSHLDARFQFRIEKLEQINGGWQVTGHDGKLNQEETLSAKNIVLAIPPQQAIDLLPDVHEHKASLLEMAAHRLVEPQWVCGVVLKSKPKNLSAVIANGTELNLDNRLHQVSNEASKPGRSDHAVLQLQATSHWTKEQLDLDKRSVASELIDALQLSLGETVEVTNSYVHHWLYSYSEKPTNHNQESTFPKYLTSLDGLHLCGDYFHATAKESGVESAYQSAMALSQNMRFANLHK